MGGTSRFDEKDGAEFAWDVCVCVCTCDCLPDWLKEKRSELVNECLMQKRSRGEGGRE